MWCMCVVLPVTTMEPGQQGKNEEHARAKEIDTGAFPLQMSNVVLGLPYKPDPTAVLHGTAKTRPWSYGDLVSQHKLLADLTISAGNSNTAGTSGRVWHFRNTWRNVVNTHFGLNFKKLFGLKSWTVNFRFQFRSNFQQVGQSLISYTNIPAQLWDYHGLTTEARSLFDIGDYMVHTQFPHRKIAMGEDVDVEVALRWLSPFEASFGTDVYDYEGDGVKNSWSEGYDMGTLFLSVPFSMEVATGVDPSMSVRIWSWLTDITYAAYTPEDSVFGT